MRSKKFNVRKECLEEVRSFISQWSEAESITPKISVKLAICSDEIVSNVVFYSNASSLEIQCDMEDDEIILTFTDDGKAFNPLEDAQEPNLEIDADKRGVGGLGIFMVKQMASDLTYNRPENSNIVVIKISLSR
ncbi:MAG: ATP-binding protein [Fibrobacter sp.]|nr:ATP-binding protein [Fibrobacter sp.]